MRLIPNKGNDRVYTPDALALALTERFATQIAAGDTVLEQCSGGGAFLRAFDSCGIRNVLELEIDRGTNFFEWNHCVDWIITNPPWGQMRKFLIHSYEVSKNVVFLAPLTHILGMRARRADTRNALFGVKGIIEIDTPPNVGPGSGFQLSCIHLRKSWPGQTDWSHLTHTNGKYIWA